MRRFQKTLPFIMQTIGRAIFFILYKLFLRIEICGTDISTLKGPLILAINHTSELDVTAVPLLLPFFSERLPIYFVANQSEKYKMFGWRSVFYGGYFFNILGGYEVYSGQRNYAFALQDHERALESGATICIFPEGRRTRDGELENARGGLGYLIWKSKATVVPIAIDTFFNISIVEFFLRRRKVFVTIGKPIEARDLVGDNPPTRPTVEEYRGWSRMVLDRIGSMLQ